MSGESYYNFSPCGPDTSRVTKEWIQKYIQIGLYGAVAYPDPVFIPEGETPTFLNLIQNSLTDPCRPDWGGWGGRCGLTYCTGASGNRNYSDVADHVLGKDGRAHCGNQATIWRWRNAYQGDFAARMQWTLGKYFQKTNHAPVVILNGDSNLDPMHLNADFGSTVHLDASQSWDPDEKDKLQFRWLHYREPSSTQWTTSYQVPKLEFKDESDSGRKFEKVSVQIPPEEDGMSFPLHPERVLK
ncbi:hypothetical protein F5882DRAFT_399248 [Hyaloscypha sp. PMI_1271]|nr:hypothetical protein F5882DRAFT_399248 [Hyaloscypha sp. PMI_1271]